KKAVRRISKLLTKKQTKSKRSRVIFDEIDRLIAAETDSTVLIWLFRLAQHSAFNMYRDAHDICTIAMNALAKGQDEVARGCCLLLEQFRARKYCLMAKSRDH
ncbi:hypothetical protein PENTCL1PPCAC_23928, partial [Pristionchus entomophagus]